MRVIDCHAHLTRTPIFGRGTILQLRKEMRASKISTTLLISEEETSETWYSSQQLAKLLDHSSLRLIADFTLHKPLKAQIQRVEELLKRGRAVGIKLYPGYQYFYPADRKVEPIYKLAQKYNVPVMIHTGDLFTEGCTRPPLLKYSHPLNVDEAAALHPEVNFIIAHCGNPWLIDCAEVMLKNRNVYADVSGLIYNKPNRNEIRRITRSFEDVFTYLGGADRFLFGTDWPIVDQRSYLAYFKRIIPGSCSEAFFSLNAVRLFSLKS